VFLPDILDLLLLSLDRLTLELMQLVYVLVVLDCVELVAGSQEGHLIDVMEVLILVELELAELTEFFFGAFDLLLELFKAEKLLLESSWLFFYNLFHEKNIIQIYYYLKLQTTLRI
jgi:hypothetical protein